MYTSYRLTRGAPNLPDIPDLCPEPEDDPPKRCRGEWIKFCSSTCGKTRCDLPPPVSLIHLSRVLIDTAAVADASPPLSALPELLVGLGWTAGEPHPTSRPFAARPPSEHKSEIYEGDGRHLSPFLCPAAAELLLASLLS